MAFHLPVNGTDPMQMFRSMSASQDGVAAAPFGYRPGSATRTNTCQQIRGVPSELRSSTYMKPSGLNYFYQKYTEAYGIPVLCKSS